MELHSDNGITVNGRELVVVVMVIINLITIDLQTNKQVKVNYREIQP